MKDKDCFAQVEFVQQEKVLVSRVVDLGNDSDVHDESIQKLEANEKKINQWPAKALELASHIA